MQSTPALPLSSAAPVKAMSGAATRPTRGALLILFAILAVAATLRFHHIGGNSFWLDEWFTMESSNGQGLASQRIPYGIVSQPESLTHLSDANLGRR